MIWKIIGFTVLLILEAHAVERPLFKLRVDTSNQESLQRGARMYMNYCSGCHSLRYMRYNRMANDLGLTTFAGEVDVDLLRNNLIFTRAKTVDPIQTSMPEVDARQWFGRLPPDLSLTARERSPDWIYTYLKSFYADSKRPFGANNLLVPDLSMPNILAPLSGIMILEQPLSDKVTLMLSQVGSMSEEEFNQSLEDLVTFLTYVAEPAKALRYKMGVIVLPFLLVFLLIVVLLKRNYWKKLEINSNLSQDHIG